MLRAFAPEAWIGSMCRWTGSRPKAKAKAQPETEAPTRESTAVSESRTAKPSSHNSQPNRANRGAINSAWRGSHSHVLRSQISAALRGRGCAVTGRAWGGRAWWDARRGWQGWNVSIFAFKNHPLPVLRLAPLATQAGHASGQASGARRHATRGCKGKREGKTRGESVGRQDKPELYL
jgi:hypothetical protein